MTHISSGNNLNNPDDALTPRALIVGDKFFELCPVSYSDDEKKNYVERVVKEFIFRTRNCKPSTVALFPDFDHVAKQTYLADAITTLRERKFFIAPPAPYSGDLDSSEKLATSKTVKSLKFLNSAEARFDAVLVSQVLSAADAWYNAGIAAPCNIPEKIEFLLDKLNKGVHGLKASVDEFYRGIERAKPSEDFPMDIKELVSRTMYNWKQEDFFSSKKVGELIQKVYTMAPNERIDGARELVFGALIYLYNTVIEKQSLMKVDRPYEMVLSVMSRHIFPTGTAPGGVSGIEYLHRAFIDSRDKYSESQLIQICSASNEAIKEVLSDYQNSLRGKCRGKNHILVLSAVPYSESWWDFLQSLARE
jgi:hypothetical protein